MKFGELFIVIYQHRLSSVMIFVIHTKNFDHIFFFFLLSHLRAGTRAIVLVFIFYFSVSALAY